ncbi:hypothetical protein KC865_01425 [Candidatus Kaiserbacteria bacterium]|nr:hypothetical protein [Candidatus Kaiserbacteria bacterium]
MFLLPDKFVGEEIGIGAKALRLNELRQAGFKVPSFGVIPARTVGGLVSSLNDRKVTLSKWCDEIKTSVPAEEYAIRSASLIEDGKKHSQAGQFKTVLKVTENQLGEAIDSVINDYVKKTGGKHGFSVIVQEYVTSDYAGVIFSRNPMGGREMVIEYSQEGGEVVVRGEKTQRIVFSPSQSAKHQSELPFLALLAKRTLDIESIYDWPQDIEWLVSNGEILFLQTRPITNISEKEWQGIKYLEKKFNNRKSFYYERTAISETFYKPSPLAFSILRSMYKKDGPIEKAYQNIGVKYLATEQFELINGELYVDKEAELKSLFPAMSYLQFDSSLPRIGSFSGLLTSVKNFLALSFVSDKNYLILKEKINNLLTVSLDEELNLKERWKFLNDNYPVLFEINLKAQRAISKLEQLLKGDKVHLPALLASDWDEALGKDFPDSISVDDWIGNSFSIDDISDFKQANANFSTENSGFSRWYRSLPKWKVQGLQPYITKAKKYQFLRERVRRTEVRLISYLRREVSRIADEHFPGETDLINFFTIDELTTENFSKEVGMKRRNNNPLSEDVSLPSLVASFSMAESNIGNVGLSEGEAVGRLVYVDDIENGSESKILYTDILSPDLTQYFDRIEGIVTKQGGMLSHLAVVAREAGLPVVMTTEPLSAGMQVRIDGSSGAVFVEGGK